MTFNVAAKRSLARRGLVVYLVILVVGSAILETAIVRAGEPINNVQRLIFALMYVPAVASVISRFVLREGFADVSFEMGNTSWRLIIVAWTFPMIVGAIAYGVAWATGLAGFEPPLPATSHLYSQSAIVNFVASLGLMATVGTAVSCVSAFGEELGWRGYMLTRLIDAGVPRPVLVSGIVWALWHVPFIVTGQYAAGVNPGHSAVVFIVGTIGIAYLMAYLRLQSGSVWLAVVLHGAWNAIIQGTFDRATTGTSAAVGESGWLTILVSLSVVVFVTRRSGVTDRP
jgi:membrane protease YdiL (CAAX protease family)